MRKPTEKASEGPGKPASALALGQIGAYLAIAIALVLALSTLFDWIALRFDLAFMSEGRRTDLASVLALVIGLWLTRFVARLVGIVPRRP